MLRLGTLFSGGLGAPEQALKQMGWEHENVFACEWDKFARINYEANHHVPKGHFHKDINDMDSMPYKGKVDIIVGGSPCQDFSIAGLRAGVDGHRGQLIWQYFRIIGEVRPPVFIYENVKGMTSDKGGKTLKDFLEVFRSIGYHCHSEVLNTKDYGVPQNRERIYIIGFLNHDHYMRFEFAPKMKLEKLLKDVLEDEVDDKYYLSNKMVTYLERKERSIKPFDGTQELSPFVLASYHKTPTDGFYVKVEAMLDIKGKDQIKRIYSKEGCSPVLTTMQGVMHEPKIFQRQRGYNDGGIKANDGVSPSLTTCSWQDNNHLLDEFERIRKLTPRECFRLQGCDDTFKIAVSDTQAYKAAGNAMSVNVLEMLFAQIDKAKKGEQTNTLLDFIN